MSDEKKVRPARIRASIIEGSEPIQKAEVPTQLNEEESRAAGDWLTPPANLRGLSTMVDESTILPQCVRAYKNNIAGFGIDLRYRDEFADKDETPEMKEEWEQAQEVLDLLSTEQDSKEIFEDVIEARETYGCAYIEVMRNIEGQVVQIEFIKDTPTIEKTRPAGDYVEYIYSYKGKDISRRRRFRKYKQTVNGEVVYYKEFGDPRVMNRKTGDYTTASIDVNDRANELMEFSIGTAAYGKVRWVGQTLTVDGARRAESLNNNYFINGRHTPLLIMVNGGTLTDESREKLKQYIDGIKGEDGQHKFLVIESELSDNRTGFTEETRPEVEVKDLAAILQKDELFQDYLDNGRRKVQSAFQLPDLYVGYTTDFNRATAQTAMEVTEKQVFQPERRSLAWAINNRLLNCYRFRYVEVFFREPDITNPDDLFKILNVGNAAGGLTPNKARAVIGKAMGETPEDFTEPWGDIPLPIFQALRSEIMSNVPSEVPSVAQGAVSGDGEGITPPAPEGSQNAPQAPENEEEPAEGETSLEEQLNGQIKKAQAAHEDDELIAVMKEVRRLLVQIDKGAEG